MKPLFSSLWWRSVTLAVFIFTLVVTVYALITLIHVLNRGIVV